MMIQIGAIGKVVGETDIYIHGEFEYTTPHRLITSEVDELCLHPVFSIVFGCRRSGDDASTKMVYPRGSGIDDQDYRGSLA